MEKRCVKSGRNITAGLVVGCVAFNSTCLLCTEDEQEVEEELEEEVVLLQLMLVCMQLLRKQLD